MRKKEEEFTSADTPLINHLSSGAAQDSQVIKDPFDNLYYVNCWALGTPDEIDFWHKYALNDDSVCIVTCAGRIEAALYGNKEHIVYFSYVDYIDRPVQSTFKMPNYRMSMIEKYFSKGRCLYQQEKEVRLMHVFKKSKHEPTPSGIYLPVDLEILIDMIYVTPSADGKQIQTVKNLLSRHNLSYISVESI